MFKRNLSLVIAAMLGAVLIACGSTDTAKTTKKADTESTEAVTELAEDTQSEETALTETQDKTETADGTVADSEKQQDSSSDTKSSEKDSASAKQETAGKDKAASTSSSSGSKTSSGSSTSAGKSDTAKSVNSSGSSGSGKTTSGSTGKTGNTGSTGNAGNTGNTGSKQETHTHTWYKYVANTIQHKEEGHYETKVVKEAYNEPKYEEHNVCNKCGYDMGTDDWNVINHGDICDGSYSLVPVQVGTIHHEEEKQQVWVVDTPAYTEYVYGEKCSGCGATK